MKGVRLHSPTADGNSFANMFRKRERAEMILQDLVIGIFTELVTPGYLRFNALLPFLYSFRRTFFRFVAAVVAMSTMEACVSREYMGLSLASGMAVELQELVRQAQAGNKQAQLNLGIRFEQGDGVPQNYHNAVTLYQMAAKDNGGSAWIYVPSVNNSKAGRVLLNSKGPRQEGIAEAKRRLEALRK